MCENRPTYMGLILGENTGSQRAQSCPHQILAMYGPEPAYIWSSGTRTEWGCCDRLHATKSDHRNVRSIVNRSFLFGRCNKNRVFNFAVAPPTWWHMPLVTSSLHRCSDRPLIENLCSSFCCIYRTFSPSSCSERLFFARQGSKS